MRGEAVIRYAFVALAIAAYLLGFCLGRGSIQSSRAPQRDHVAAYPVGRFPFYVVEGHRIGVVTSVSGSGYTAIVGSGYDVREVHRSWRDLFLHAK